MFKALTTQNLGMKHVLIELELNVSLYSAIDKRNHGLKIKNILSKAPNRRIQTDIDELVGLVHEIKFFKDRKDIKPQDFRELVTAIQYTEIEQGKSVIKYGEPGENFFIILSGKVSV